MYSEIPYVGHQSSTKITVVTPSSGGWSYLPTPRPESGPGAPTHLPTPRRSYPGELVTSKKNQTLSISVCGGAVHARVTPNTWL